MFHPKGEAYTDNQMNLQGHEIFLLTSITKLALQQEMSVNNIKVMTLLPDYISVAAKVVSQPHHCTLKQTFNFPGEKQWVDNRYHGIDALQQFIDPPKPAIILQMIFKTKI